MIPFDLTDDAVLLRLLAHVIAEGEPIPGEAVAAVKAIAGLPDVDSELATLVADGALDDDVALFRHDASMEPVGEPNDRMVSFAGASIAVDVELCADGRTVMGAITPPVSLPVELETVDGAVATRSDDLGRFRLASGPGPCRVRIHAADGVVVTPWMTR